MKTLNSLTLPLDSREWKNGSNSIVVIVPHSSIPYYPKVSNCRSLALALTLNSLVKKAPKAGLPGGDCLRCFGLRGSQNERAGVGLGFRV